MSNAALLYLFQRSEEASLPGHSSYEVTMRTHFHPPANQTSFSTSHQDPQSTFSFSHFLPSFLPTSGSSGALVAAILSALASEHAYGIFRVGVRHLLERVVWRDSKEEIALRKGECEARKTSAKSAFKGNAEEGGEYERRALAEGKEDEFWNEEKNVGMEVIENSGKTE